jgi:glycosyltransferase involved in cell wall biosynthesis
MQTTAPPAPPSPRAAPAARAPAAPAVPLRVAYFATQGAGSGDEARIAALLAPFAPVRLRFERARKARSCAALLGRLLRERPDVVVMEGSGLAGGIAVLGARVLAGVPYVVSSGDAVGPYLGLLNRWLVVPGRLYERLLYRRSAGFIGWSPYLVGRALSLGARRAMTAAHWADFVPTEDERRTLRARTRAELGIPDAALVVGIVGSLAWSAPRGYCYGLELVRALRATTREDVRVLIVGDGDGRARLEALAGEDLGRRVLMTGAVPRERVPALLCAMDVASLPQSLDEVGAVRYTTKLSEYLAAGVPIVTGQLPLAYDLDDGWLWRLAGTAPWELEYATALTHLLETLDAGAAAARRARVPRRLPIFDFARQQRAVEAFVNDAARAAQLRQTRPGDARAAG